MARFLSLHRGVLLLIVLFTAILYSAVTRFEFLLVDDTKNIFENPYYLPLTSQHLAELWTRPYNSLYMPVTYTIWGWLSVMGHLETPVQSQNMGVSPFSPSLFHVANLACHLFNVALVYGLLLKLVRLARRDRKTTPVLEAVAVSAGTLLFALHPAQVESVAWVTGMNNTLSGTFALLTVHAFLLFRAVKSPALWYGLTLLAFVLALLSKPTILALPLALFAIDGFLLRKTFRESAIALAPCLLMAILLAVMTRGAQEPENLAYFSKLTTIWQRPFIAGDALAFYLAHLVLPLHSGFGNGRNPEYVLSHWWGYVTGIVPTVLLLGVGWWVSKGHETGRGYAVALIWFVVALLPMLGFVPFYSQPVTTIADRYLYLALVGASLALSLALEDLLPRKGIVQQGIAGIVAVYLTFLLVQTVRQVPLWANTETLCGEMLATYPRSAFGYRIYGDLLTFQRRFPEAIAAYDKAIEIKPDHVRAHVQRGFLLGAVGRRVAAEEEFRECLRLSPHLPEVELNLGQLLAMEGRFAEAEELLRSVVKQVPNDALSYFTLGRCLMMQKKDKEAITFYEKGLILQPNTMEAHRDLNLLRERLSKPHPEP